MWLLLLLACPKSGTPREDALDRALLAADAAWAARDRNGLEPVAEALLAAEAIAPSAPALLWRQVRHRHALSFTLESPRERLEMLADARSVGWRCVTEDPSVVALRSAEGVHDALRHIELARRPCATWTAIAWARWSLAFGRDAAALDQDTIQTLYERSRTDDVVEATWARGLLHVAREQTEEAATAFSRVLEDRPDRTGGLAAIDQATLRSGSLPWQELDTVARSPEARAWLGRLREER